MTAYRPLLSVAVLRTLAGCAKGWLESFAPSSSGPHSTTYIDGRAITTYHYGLPRDPLGSVHQYRPDIYHRFYGPH